jgi:lipopolysaccharide transport system ATP-binding protein
MHPDLTGRENTFLMGVIGGLTRQQVRKRFGSIVDFAELEEFIDSPVRTYSSGMLMRLAFAIAVQTDPQILLVDEVLAVGDLAFQRKCLDRIRQIKAQGCAILLVTHDSHAVKDLCDEALWLRGGETVAFGPAEIIVGRYVAEMSVETQRLTPGASSRSKNETNGALKFGVNRFGSGEMKISGFRLLNQFGVEVTVVESGEPVIIEISYDAPRRIVSPIFNASISDQNYLMVIDISTDAKGSTLPDLIGTGKITLKIDRLDLRAETYHISVGVYQKEWSHAYDYHWQAYNFDLRTGPRQAGLLHVPHHWTLTVDEKRKAPEAV